MATVSTRLEGAVREFEEPLAEALTQYSSARYLEWLDSDLQLTYSQCGVATAALQQCLSSVGIRTDRRKLSTSLRIGEQSPEAISHVVLQSDDGEIIDPTYTQFYRYIGLDSQLAQQCQDMRRLLPERKVAVFREADEQVFARTIALHALNVRRQVSDALASRILEFPFTMPVLLEYASSDSVQNFYRSVWRMKSYSAFPFALQVENSPAFGDYVDDIVESIVS